MSRYTIAGLNPSYEVVVGWDRAGGLTQCATFFGQVFDKEVETKIDKMTEQSLNGQEIDEEELNRLEKARIVFLSGDDFANPIKTMEQLEAHIAHYANIPEDIKLKLKQDAIESESQPKSVFVPVLANLLNISLVQEA